MYLKQISDINIGPLNDVSITFPFEESGNPKPVIIVGENGTGKTTFLSNVVDSLYELAEKAFNDVTQSDGGTGHQYFKAISPSEIQIGKEYMCSIIEYTCPQNPTYSIGYVMKCGSVSADLIKIGNSFCATKKFHGKIRIVTRKLLLRSPKRKQFLGEASFVTLVRIDMKNRHVWEKDTINKTRIYIRLLENGGKDNCVSRLLFMM